MSNEGSQLSHKDRQAWTQYHREQVKAGNFIRRGNMKLVKDSDGAYYRANGAGCCECGYHQQANQGIGNPNKYDKPPTLNDTSQPGSRWWQ